VVVDNIDQDDIHPTAVITSPASGAIVDGSVLIETLVTDNLEIDKVEFFINNESVYTDSIGSDYSFLWETDTLPDDEHYVLAVISYDLVGNEGPSTAITVYLDNDDNVLPHGSILYPYAGQIVSGVETVSINAEDNNSIDTVEFYINNILVFSDGTQPYEYDWDTNLEMEDLNHIVGSIIRDDSGNQFEVPSISVLVNNIPNDSNPPTITISNPLSGQTVSDTVNFLVAAYDDIGIAYVEFFIDGFTLGTDDEAPFSYLWDTASNIGVHGNQHALSAIVVDTAGNTTFSQPILVIVED
jgi:hypothetical protein